MFEDLPQFQLIITTNSALLVDTILGHVMEVKKKLIVVFFFVFPWISLGMAVED